MVVRRRLAALMLVWPLPVAAQTAQHADEARELVTRGVELRKHGDDREALRLFERAVELDPSPQALAQRALAEQALGLWLDAADHLEEALARGDDPWIVDHRTALEAARQEIASRLGALEVSCNVPGAEIRVDGRVLGRTPLTAPLRVVAGQSVVQIAAPGYLEITRRVEVDAQRLSRLDVTLIASLPRDSEAPRAADTMKLPSRPPERAVVSRQDRAASPREILLYTSIGLAGVGVVVGATGYVLREVNVRLYNDDSRCNVRVGVRRSDECPDEAAAWRRGETLAIAGAASASVFGALALYLFLERPRAPQQGLGFCGIGPGAVVCSRRF